MRRKGIVAFIWRLTRTTSIVVALAVMLALVAGVISLAVAKPPDSGTTPTKTLLLNTLNNVSGVTSMKGSLPDPNPILQLINDGGGPALDLKVNSGMAPMTVNSETKVEKLNADTVDGKNATDFAPAGSAPPPPPPETASFPSTYQVADFNETGEARAFCDEGDKALSATYQITNPNVDLVRELIPYQGRDNNGYILRWIGTLEPPTPTDGAGVTVICVDLTPEATP